jgi:chromosome segregation ATPase
MCLVSAECVRCLACAIHISYASLVRPLQGPLQVVLDMHSSTVEKLNRVTITCEQLQAENDQLLSKLQREDKRIGFEESTIQNLSRTADFLEQALEKIEARMIVVFRTTFDQDDQREMKAMYEKVETRLKQELEELQDRTAKERKLAARVPELLKALDDQKDALDEKASECESLKLDKQVLEEKVRMITKRAEKAEQGREHVLTRESELVEKTKELSAEIAAQRKNIASMQGQLRDFHHAKLELERFKQSSAEASKSLNEAWRENAQLQVQVERGASDLHESQSKVREFQVKLYKEEMESRKIHEQFDSMAKSVKEYREELFQTQRLCDTRVEELQVSLDALNQHVNSQEVETEKVHESLDPVEHRIELLEQAVLHMLQSHKGEQLKNEMQEIQIRMLAEKQREVNSLLQDESAKLASSDAENARLRLQVEVSYK